MTGISRNLWSVAGFFLMLLFLSAAGPFQASADVIVDNGDPGTSFTGTWYVSGGSYPYDYVNDPEADSLWARNGATYTWQFDAQPSGTYEVYMWWSEHSSRPENAAVTITHGSGSSNVTVNQKLNAGQWNSLGQFSFNGSGSVKIIAANGSTVSTCADAVWFRYVSSDMPKEIIIDNGAAGTSFTGTWSVSGASGYYGTESLWSRDGTTYTWTFTPQQSGEYDLSMWWTEWSSRSDAIPVDIQHAGGSTRVSINQLQNGAQWNLLGRYAFDAGVIYNVTITSQPYPVSTCADAVKFVYASGTHTITATAGTNGSITPSGAVTVDDGADQTFTITPDVNYRVADVLVDGVSEGVVTSYTFSTVTVDHMIDATFEAITATSHTITATAGTNGSITPSGAVTVDDGADQTFTITPDANYRVADVLVDGVSAGEVTSYAFTGVTADHTIEAVFEPGEPTAEIIIDNGDPQTSFTGAWSASGASGFYGTDSVWSRDGSTYTWTFTPLQSGQYDLSMWWTVWSSRSTSIPVDIEYADGSTTVHINQQQNGGRWNLLGNYAFQAGVNYQVTITAQPGPSSTCADAVKFSYIPGGNRPPVAVIDAISPNPALPGETVTFTGHGEDSDGSIKAYNWRSDKDGLLSEQAPFSLSAMSAGVHTIFFKVLDDKDTWSPEISMVLYQLGCDSPVRIMSLGNSITYGIGEIGDADYTTGYRQPLYQALFSSGYNIDFVGERQNGQSVVPPFDIDHQGIPGIMDDAVADNVYNYLTALPATIVLLHIGTNALETSAADVEKILNEIDRYSKEVTVVLARIIDHKTHYPDITVFNDNVQAMALQRIAAGDKIIIVDQEHALTYPDDMWDTLHPKNTGYNKMAEVWFNALDNILPRCGQFAPFIYTYPKTGAEKGQPYSYNVGANGLPAPSFSLKNAPQGMAINSSTGLIQWTPTVSGDFDVNVEADNGIGAPATQAFTVNVATTITTIIDNGDPRTSYTGLWIVSGGSNPYDYLNDPAANSLYSRDGDQYAWTFTPVVSGNYEVSMWWTVWPSRSNSIPVKIEHSDGTANLNINQQLNGGQWNVLGTYSLQAGVNYKVTITAQPGPSSTCADAVKFVYILP